MINTFKHDSRAVVEQRLIGNLVGVQQKGVSFVEVYIHRDFSKAFLFWLNDHCLPNGPGSKWQILAFDANVHHDFMDADMSNDLKPLYVGRTKVGYARGPQSVDFYRKGLPRTLSSSAD